MTDGPRDEDAHELSFVWELICAHESILHFLVVLNLVFLVLLLVAAIGFGMLSEASRVILLVDFVLVGTILVFAGAAYRKCRNLVGFGVAVVLFLYGSPFPTTAISTMGMALICVRPR